MNQLIFSSTEWEILGKVAVAMLLGAATVFSVTPPQPSFAYAVNLLLIQR